MNFFKPKYIKKGFQYISENGLGAFKEKLKAILYGINYYYPGWFEANKADAAELARQREEKLSYNPLISVVVPTYNTPEKYLREMIESVMNQSYQNWQLCIADGSDVSTKAGALAVSVLKEYVQKDSRIVCTFLEKNRGISENTNAALELAKGEYVGLFDHDDLLTPDALYHIARALNEEQYDILYTDEDMMDSKGKKLMNPKFKPDFSMDLLMVHNYITHFFVARTDLFRKVGGFDRNFDGAQDYDIILKCVEQTSRIRHIPKMLYHWRVHKASTAGNPESKLYAYENGRKALQAHLDRMGIKATVENTDMWGLYDVKYVIGEPPLISIIIPNKDHIDDLDKCVSSIYDRSDYKNIEFVVVENNSTEDKTFQYYKEMEAKHESFHVVYWKKGFNYSAINNYGVSFAKGDYILLLNNDTELMSTNAISRMLGICMREDVGVVGAKLFYGDDTIQHAGVVIGFGGYAGHVFNGMKDNELGYMMRAKINSNFSAVTAACLLTKKSVYDAVGGLSEEFVVACNDVDYCLKVREQGLLVTYCADAKWHHYESKSRGYEDTLEKAERFAGEVSLFQKKWKDVLENGDPFYNVNFPVSLPPFTLAQ
ncbi:MAG: glycosyltransferase [Clostridium sp.]|nr:glycosyltransferase [Clostridium sp.]MCM1399808.1 glycosyltransferase [Clostridium sp.]MCM1459565.1 glycosyltransferase [Bacteroides sp.]